MPKKTDPVIIMDTAPEILASSIKSVADSAKKLLNSPMEKRAILVLLKDKTGIPMADISRVLDGAANLDSYLKKEKR